MNAIFPFTAQYGYHLGDMYTVLGAVTNWGDWKCPGGCV